MKKRGILLSAMFLFILMTGSHAIYEESVYSGTVKHGEEIEVSDRNFQFRIDHVSSKVVVDIDSSGIIIENGECRIKNNFDVCVKNISFSHRNLTTYIDVYQAEIKIYQVKSNVEVAHTIDKSSILIDEEATAELSVENTADIAAKDFAATIPIPDSIMVTGYEGCKKSLGSIVFREDIQPKQVKKCTYKVKGLFGDEFYLEAAATYFDGLETVSADSDPLSVKVYNYSLKISSQLNKSRFESGEILNFTANIENINDQYELTVTTFSIKVPDNILIIKQPKGMVTNNKILSWSGNLIPKEKKSFVAGLQAKRTGNRTIIIEASYKISKFIRNTDYKSSIEVSCDCPYIHKELSPEAYAPGQKILLKAFLINPDNSKSFGKLKVDYATSVPELQGLSTNYQEIKPKESIKVFDSSFNAPEFGHVYHFNISAIYEFKDEVFVKKESIIIKVPEPVADKPEDKQEQAEEMVVEELISEEANETEESMQGEIQEDIPVITLENKKENPLMSYMAVGIIAAIMFAIVVFVVFRNKSKRKEVPQPVKREVMQKKYPSVKEILQLDLLKKENAQVEINKPQTRLEDESYRSLKKQIERLGIQPEGQKPKKGFLFFWKK